MKDYHIGIIGFGRFGQFWADVLKKYYPVVVTDKHELAALAKQQNIQFVNLAQLCAQSNIVFLCVPINQIETTVREIKNLLSPGTVVFDTCSVKQLPAEWIENGLADRPDVGFIATHPTFGPDSGKGGVKDLRLVIWNVSAPIVIYEDWKMFFEEVLELQVIPMTPREHDYLAAYSQGVTHYIGRVLGEMNVQSTSINTTGFEKLLSVLDVTCNDTWELFHDLQTYNPYTKDMRIALETALNITYDRLLLERVDPANLVIGVQGGRGSFNEEACRSYCRLKGIKGAKIEYLYTARNVLSKLHRGEIDRAIFAVQNSAGGVVMETIRGLSQYNCEIEAQFGIIISHCILHHPEVEFGEIDTLVSHPQALMQCRRTLDAKYPKPGNGSAIEHRLRRFSFPDSDERIDQARCAQYIAEGKLPRSWAVLASRACAQLYGLQVHDTDLQDLGTANITTFLWARRRSHQPKPELSDAVNDRPEWEDLGLI